jgi:putrescine importer
MLLTADSYMIMVKKFPLSGSLYTYVSRGISPRVGFIAGWVLLLDYILIPTVTAVSAVLYLQHYLPNIAFPILLIGYIFITGSINILGIKLLTNIGLWLLVLGEGVLVSSFIIWGHFVVETQHGVSSLFSLSPFSFNSVPSLLTATSIAVLSYLGFDAITTLAEEANNPKRDIPRAIILSVLIGGSTMILTGYLGILASPDIANDIHNLNWQQTALFYILILTGGTLFAEIYTAGFIISMLVFNVVATAAGARLMFGMGRDGALPKCIFAKVNQKFHTPHYNIIIIILIECFLGLILSVGLISEMVDFGALMGFSLLNISILFMIFKKRKDVKFSMKVLLRHVIIPLLGAMVMVFILVSMNYISLIIGCSWFLIGVIYVLVRKVPPAV